MRRRDFIVVLGAVTFRSAARARQPGMQVVGYLHCGSHDPASSAWAAFLQGMREVGYIEGRNVSFEIQSAADQYDRLPALAESLVDRHVPNHSAPFDACALLGRQVNSCDCQLSTYWRCCAASVYLVMSEVVNGPRNGPPRKWEFRQVVVLIGEPEGLEPATRPL
jgi:hypothetical protein